MFSALVDLVVRENHDEREIALHLIATNFAAIHTVSIVHPHLFGAVSVALITSNTDICKHIAPRSRGTLSPAGAARRNRSMRGELRVDKARS